MMKHEEYLRSLLKNQTFVWYFLDPDKTPEQIAKFVYDLDAEMEKVFKKKKETT